MLKPGEVGGWEGLVLDSCKHTLGWEPLGYSPCSESLFCFAVVGSRQKRLAIPQEKNMATKRSPERLSQTQTKATLWCNDWRGKSSRMIIFLPPWVEGKNYLITIWPSHLSSLRNDRWAYVPLEDHKYCYSTESRPNKTLIPWYFGRLVRRFMIIIKFRGAKTSGCFISMQKILLSVFSLWHHQWKKSSLEIAFFSPKQV